MGESIYSYLDELHQMDKKKRKRYKGYINALEALDQRLNRKEEEQDTGEETKLLGTTAEQSKNSDIYGAKYRWEGTRQGPGSVSFSVCSAGHLYKLSETYKKEDQLWKLFLMWRMRLSACLTQAVNSL